MTRTTGETWFMAIIVALLLSTAHHLDSEVAEEHDGTSATDAKPSTSANLLDKRETL